MFSQPLTTPGKLPEQKAPKSKLIVLMAFDKGDDGELLPAFTPREMPDESNGKGDGHASSRRDQVVEGRQTRSG